MKVASASNNTPLSIRPTAEERAQLAQIAMELRKSEPSLVADFMTDCLQMLETGQYGVPPTVHMIRVLREARATLNAKPVQPSSELRDKREVAFYTTIEGGRTSGMLCDNPPDTIPIPEDWTQPVDFVLEVHGNSMTGLIEDGELGAFVAAEKATPGQVVAAIVDSQAMLKIFTPTALVSLNKSHPPIPMTAEVRIQGVFVDKFPDSRRGKGKKSKP